MFIPSPHYTHFLKFLKPPCELRKESFLIPSLGEEIEVLGGKMTAAKSGLHAGLRVNPLPNKPHGLPKGHEQMNKRKNE